MADSAYDLVLELIREVHATQTVQYLLEWDLQTFMPHKGAGHRAAQIGVIAAVAHQKLTAAEMTELLARAEEQADGSDPVVATNLREIRRDHSRAARLPTALVQQIATATALAMEAWEKARAASDFALFAPHLEHLLDLKRQVAEHIGWQTEPYDALLDEFEPGARAADIQQTFAGLKRELVPLVAAISAAPRQPDTALLELPAAVEKQSFFNRSIAAAMGFDFEAGRMDISVHPFCSGFCPGDVRMTTRYAEREVAMSLFGVMHETGHALYEQGLDPAHTGTPMGSSVSLGIHESQSRLWENMIGRGRPFWEYFYPHFQAEFPAWREVRLEDWLFAVNTVRPSFIRVEADEVTYGLHIMLRFDLERHMLAGKLAVRDIPEAWNEGMRQLLGITPASDAQGCLQDVHWSIGLIGYFPTYALGNLYAAQFFAAANRAIPDLAQRIARGDLHSLLHWLRENIHRHGKRYRAAELVEVVTGGPLSHQPYIDYLKRKYQPLYGF
jgi:carboxypeptidase Taq